MYNTILLLHSWTRWLVLVFGLIAIFRAYSGWQNRRSFTSADNGMDAAFVGSMHLQLLLGLILYFVLSPYGLKAMQAMGGQAMKDPVLRFWGVEHLVVMILAWAAAQIGRSKSKKIADAVQKHKTAFIWFTVSLVLVLIMIPWGIWNPERPLFRV